MSASAYVQPRRSADAPPLFLVATAVQPFGSARVPSPGPCAAQFISEFSASCSFFGFLLAFKAAPFASLTTASRPLTADRICYEPVMKIADVANKWGFWHLGQLAKDYRSWFQELPSDTHERRHRKDSSMTTRIGLR
jgi:hypothetical protein